MHGLLWTISECLSGIEKEPSGRALPPWRETFRSQNNEPQECVVTESMVSTSALENLSCPQHVSQPSCVHTCPRSRIGSDTHRHKHTCTDIKPNPHVTCTSKHARTYSHIHAQTHTNTNLNTKTQTCTNTKHAHQSGPE
jgi:hypothetical protein